MLLYIAMEHKKDRKLFSVTSEQRTKYKRNTVPVVHRCKSWGLDIHKTLLLQHQQKFRLLIFWFVIYFVLNTFCNIYAQKNPGAYSETLLKCLTANGFIVLKLDDATRSLIKEYFSLGKPRSWDSLIYNFLF